MEEEAAVSVQKFYSKKKRRISFTETSQESKKARLELEEAEAQPVEPINFINQLFNSEVHMYITKVKVYLINFFRKYAQKLQ